MKTLQVPAGRYVLVIQWQGHSRRPRVRRIRIQPARSGKACRRRHRSGRCDCRPILTLGRLLRRALAGKAIRPPLSLLALEKGSAFEQAVWRAAARIPRGRVLSYSELAAQLGRPRAARAVGNALAKNPFPLAIPCHRVVCSDGRIGGYSAGAALKRHLLAREFARFHRQKPRQPARRSPCAPGSCTPRP